MSHFGTAQNLIRQFKGDSYRNGFGILQQAGELALALGRRAALVRETFPGSESCVAEIRCALTKAGIVVAVEIPGAKPNAPKEDVVRIAEHVRSAEPDLLVSFGGGSTIDATKAAGVIYALGGDIDSYFGTGLVTQKLNSSGKRLIPHLAIQTAASSAAHLTKYSNITFIETGQKKLIVDDAIVPARAMFDYEVTTGAPPALTVDGGLDGVSHCLEVLYSAVGKPYYGLMEQVAREGIGLVLANLPRVVANPSDREARAALGYATDLGGYAIMLGGTNGAHLTSFSLIDILSHGRACAILNPYYTVFFAPAIQASLNLVLGLCKEQGLTAVSPGELHGRDLGVAVAEALLAFELRVGIPTRLSEVPGFTDLHIQRALTAAKNPQLKMKLENMPVPLGAENVDDYMGPVLQAAKTGDLALIRSV